MTDYQPGSNFPPQDPQFQQPMPGYALPRQKVRPGRIWYLLTLAIFVAGIVWVTYGFTSLIGTVNGLQRVPLPSGGTVNLTHSGGYTIYYEGPGAQSGDVPFFHINIRPASPGAALSNLQQYGSTVTYNIGSHQGRAALTLNVTHPGSFTVTATGAPPAGADLAFGGSIGSGIVGALVPAIPLIILGVVGTVILLIIRIARKRSLQRGYAAFRT
jgi:hypothetical protein